MTARARKPDETFEQYRANLRIENEFQKRAARRHGLLYISKHLIDQGIDPITGVPLPMKVVEDNGPARRIETPEGRAYIPESEFEQLVKDELKRRQEQAATAMAANYREAA
jgi:hypothetical protein